MREPTDKYARNPGPPKWDPLLSPIKRVVRDDVFRLGTVPGDVLAHSRELAVRFRLKHVEALRACDGFEFLRVEVPPRLPDADQCDFGSLVRREKIVGWLFERERVPGLPITLASVIVDIGEFYFGRHFGCIKHPDGRIEPIGGSHDRTLGMCNVPAPLLVADEATWLASIKDEYLGYLARVRAFETGRDADGNAVCQAYFGGCPRCGQYRMLNIGSFHWGLCDLHTFKWPIGSDIVSDWQGETEAEWQENADLLAEYTVVESLAPGALIPKPSSSPPDLNCPGAG